MIGHGQGETIMRKDGRASKGTVSFVRIRTVLNPIVTGKIDCLPNVGPVTESTMKGSRKGNDKLQRMTKRHLLGGFLRKIHSYHKHTSSYLSFVLDQPANWNIGILQQPRTKHGGNVMQQIGYISHFHGEIALKDRLEAIGGGSISGNPVPLFGCPPMVIVDGIQIIVFIVVGKGGK